MTVSRETVPLCPNCGYAAAQDGRDIRCLHCMTVSTPIGSFQVPDRGWLARGWVRKPLLVVKR